MTAFHANEIVEPKLPLPTVAAELGVFGATGGLADAVAAFGNDHAFSVYAPAPGVDVFADMPKADRVLVILQPGVYEERTFRMPFTQQKLWIYGIPGEQRPQIIGTGPGRFMAATSGKTLMIENCEISAFGGDAITQSAEADLLLRNCFVHSNGGRALFRGVGSYLSPTLGGTYLIDSELRDALSHTVYLDYGDRAVVSGCHIHKAGKHKHGIKNISRRALVEFSRFESLEDQTTPYDGMSGTDYAMVRGNTFVMHASSGAMVSLQTRSAANGNFPAYPLPEMEWLGMAQAHLDAASFYIDSSLSPGWGFSQKVAQQDYKTGTAPSEMWTDEFWRDFRPREQYWLNNKFELAGDQNKAAQMVGLAVAHAHPCTWSQSNGVPLPVSAAWRDWLTEKVGGKATIRIVHKGNRFPAGLIDDINWRKGTDAYYGDFPDRSDAVVELSDEALQPTDVDPMLRRWTGVDFVRATAGQQPGEPIPLPTEPEPKPEPPVIVTPPVEETPPPVEPTPPSSTPYWETVGVMSEFSNASEHYRQVLQRMRRVTY